MVCCFRALLVALLSLAGGAYGQGIFDYGATAPVPGTYDISQLTSSSGEPPGLNYYVDTGNPGQTFTTGNSLPRYGLAGLYIQEQSGTAGGGMPQLSSYTLRIYQVSGTTATLLTSYISTNQTTFTQGDWLQWTGLNFTFQPNTTYGFALSRNGSGWWQLACSSSSGFTGGQAASFPTTSGTLTFSSSSGYDAAFDLVLVSNSDPNATATIIVPTPAPIGADVLIHASSGGTTPITNQWFFVSTNGVTTQIQGATNTYFVVSDVQKTNAGTYYMVASNSMGVVTNTPATLTVTSLAGSSVDIIDFGTNMPAPGANDIPQLLAAGETAGGNDQDGLNYYADSADPPGQTFTTGSNPNGYVINGIYIDTAGLDSSGTGTAQSYTLRLYSVSGSTATLLSTYVTGNLMGFPDGDWLLYSGGFTNILQPNTVYAYTHHRNTTGWDLLAYDTGNPYPGGEMCVIPPAGGAITFCSSGNSDATFDISLSTMPTIPVISQQPVSQTVVVGQPTSFSVGVLGVNPTYQWFTSSNTNYSNPSPISGATSSTYSIPSPTLSSATNYFVVMDGSVTSSVATLTVRLSVNTLAWLGSSSFNWDLTTGNWSNTVTQAAGFVYQTGDNVQFTDAGKNSSPINLTAALSPTSVTVTSSNNYVFAGSGSLAGNVQLTKSDTGILTVSNANTFNGTAAINNGILQLANANALGNPTNAVNMNGGTLDLNGVAAPTSLQYNIQGAGNTNEGAINNSTGTAIQNGNGILGVNLQGNATIGANGRWDLNGDGGGAGLQGNNFNLTKVGSGTVFFIDAGTNNQLGNVTVVGGTLGFQGNNNFGNAADAINVNVGATLAFYATAQNVPLVKNDIVLSNAFFSNGGANLVLNSPITLLGNNTISPGYEETVNQSDTFNSPITGTGGLVINSIQNYIFNGTNTYSGETLVDGDETLLTVGANSSLGNSSFIQIGNANAIIDVSQTPGLTLGSGQTLSGIGTLYGNVTNGTGSILLPGVSGPGTLTLGSGNLTLANATIPIDLGSDPTQVGNGVNSLVSVSGNLTLNGVSTIQISPVGPLSSAQPYTILNYGGSLSGGSANLQVTGSNPRYNLSVVNPATTPGAIEISVSGVAANLVWKGGNSQGPNIWNHSISNFFNSGTSAYDHFYDGDLVTFNDTAVTNIVNVTDTNTPGSLTFANNTLAYTLVGDGNIEGALSQQGAGTVTYAISNTPALLSITNDAGTLAFDLPLNTTLNAVISDNGAGLGTIMQAGTNTLVLAGNNSGYAGTFAVTNGILQFTGSTALGSSTSLYATNGGTLDLNNTATGAKNIAISGNGFEGQGAIADLTTTYPPYPYQLVQNLTLVGNAYIGSNARWDLTNSVTGNDFTLTKVGTGQVTFIGLGATETATGLGNIIIDNGNLTFQQNIDMGDPTKTCTVESNASLTFWAGVNPFVKTNVILINGTISSGGSANTLEGTVTLQPGTNYLSPSADLYLTGPVVGTGGFTESGGANLWLEGTNTYTGPTTIGGNSTTIVEANSSLGSSSTIEIDGGSTLNVQAPTSFDLGTGQTLIGNGTVLGGNTVFGSGSTLAAGFSGGTYTLTMTGKLAFETGSTNYVAVDKTVGIANDEVVSPTLVTMGGTLVITNLGNALASGDAIQLFSATNYSGSFSSIIPATPGPGLAWNTSTLDTDGTLLVVSVAVLHIASVSITGTNLVLSGSGGTANSGYSVLTQTNLLQPLSNWTLVGTNTFNGSGNFSFTNGITTGTPSRFYLIRVP